MVNSKLVEGNATPERRSSGEEGGGGKIKKAIASSGAWSSSVVLEPVTVNGRDQLVHRGLSKYFQRKVPILLGCMEKRCIGQGKIRLCKCEKERVSWGEMERN